MGGGGLKQLQEKLVDRALVRCIHGGPGGWPLVGVARGQHPFA